MSVFGDEVPYDIQEDVKETEFEAWCVWGDENPCDQTSGIRASADSVMSWKHEHTEQTGHTRYRNVESDYEVWVPRRRVQPPRLVPQRAIPVAKRRVQT